MLLNLFGKQSPVAGQNPGTPPPKEASLADRVRHVIDSFRPLIRSDGGDIELVSVDETGLVRIRLSGACAGCPASLMTVQLGVEARLREVVPEVRAVIDVTNEPDRT